MILSLTLLAMAQMAEPVPSANEEIVVIAEKLKGWSGKVSDTLGIRRCRTTRSTGDKAIDAIGCRVAMDCFASGKKELMAAAKAAGRDPEQRKAAMAPIEAEITACAKERRAALIADFPDQRAAAENDL